MRALAVGAAVAWGASLAGGQQPAGSTEPGDVERGSTLFRIHCASCHGTGGEGDGPVAEALRVPPADLTRLASEADGRFPELEVWAAIDGRSKVPGHGSSEMPVWGLSFQDRGRADSQESEVRAQIGALVKYLETLQRR
jgi:mono/diheme cytochrome c family protein